ncbi:SDR family NAD(P)-dependent oxidoreductase [Mycobacteroides chelonae]|uniref:SDR family NAD(P)-dependent oxidoreductase n=1 Tax=Mycobacteroides chelonae TaxID=1774 RepID=UPI0008A9A7AE|nr:SDR family NAD(P)-dependent oxidoreductase [Mycobacteroides chelonae]OHU63633.1 short-chain dehydrogenase/reductase [Mycobacteroides chelonae]
MVSKVWLITGASRGLGRAWASAALERGDQVAAAVRDPASVDDLAERFGNAVLPVQLDVTDRARALEAVAAVGDHFGRVDVVVNNAGFAQLGAVEELAEAHVRAQFETNVFGTIWLVQAALPILRAQRSGHILNVSSLSGVSAFGNSSLYSASKWAIEGFSQALRCDLAHLGIRVSIIEPGPYDTQFSAQAAQPAKLMPEYQDVRDDVQQQAAALPRGRSLAASAKAVLAVVDAPDPPLRILLGEHREFVAAEYVSRLAEWRRWESVSIAAGR